MTNPIGLTGVILSGGQGRRMGYQNKGLQLFNDLSMVEHATARLSPMVDNIIISANQDIDAYQKLGFTVIPDMPNSHLQGPLLGLHSIAASLPSSCQAVLVNPCDTPLLSTTNMQQLWQAWQTAQASGTDIVMAQTANMLHPSIFIVRKSALLALQDYQPSGQHFGLRRWAHSLQYHDVLFDDEWRFANINDINSLLQFEQQAKAKSC